jgi:CheY-like chemotaxis protein
MDGEITLESVLGSGSRFTVLLPQASGAADELPAAAAAGSEIGRAHESRGNRGETRVLERRATPVGAPAREAAILIVEDNEDNLFTLRQILAPLSLDIATASNGRQAIAQCRRQLPDLVLMDMQLPGMSGLQATGAIRALPGGERVPIIALTAQAMKGDRERILAAGCDEYVAKPVQPIELRTMVARLVGADAPATATASDPPAAL